MSFLPYPIWAFATEVGAYVCITAAGPDNGRKAELQQEFLNHMIKAIAVAVFTTFVLVCLTPGIHSALFFIPEGIRWAALFAAHCAAPHFGMSVFEGIQPAWEEFKDFLVDLTT